LLPEISEGSNPLPGGVSIPQDLVALIRGGKSIQDEMDKRDRGAGPAAMNPCTKAGFQLADGI
jgi:hypothetical protein